MESEFYGEDLGCDVCTDVNLVDAARETCSGIESTADIDSLAFVDEKMEGESLSHSDAFEWEKLSFSQGEDATLLEMNFDKAGFAPFELTQETDVSEQKGYRQFNALLDEALTEGQGFPMETASEAQEIQSGLETVFKPENELSGRTVSRETVENVIQTSESSDELYALRDALQSGKIILETEDSVQSSEVDRPKVLTRELTDEMLESRERDTQETLDNYRPPLRQRCVSEENINAYLDRERQGMEAEYQALDHGDTESAIYEISTNWDAVAESLANSKTPEISQEPELSQEKPEISPKSELSEEVAEILEAPGTEIINCDDIYADIERESLEEGFACYDIDVDAERLHTSIVDFEDTTWQAMSLEQQKDSISNLAEYVSDTIGLREPPIIEYYNNSEEGDFGGYDVQRNTLSINEYMLNNSSEAADTVAHELWHAHQHECAAHPANARDYQYQFNFENYILPELGQEAYESQFVESEARAFAAQFKDRLAHLRGRL